MGGMFVLERDMVQLGRFKSQCSKSVHVPIPRLNRCIIIQPYSNRVENGGADLSSKMSKLVDEIN